MKYIAKRKNNDFTLNLKKGTILFHGTLEKYDINDIRPGGYDKILWTAEDSAIAQSYIPISGSSMYISTSNIVKPTKSEDIRNVQRKIGIIYDYDNIEFINNTHTSSYKSPDIFKDINREYSKINDELSELDNKLKEIDSIIDNDSYNIDVIKKYRKEIYNITIKKDDLLKKLNEKSPEKLKNDIVNNYLINELNYKPTDDYYNQYNKNYNWKLRFISNKLLKGDELPEGRLVILKTKTDLEIYDMTMSGKIDGDLTDLDYHKLDLFDKLEKKGYDGVKINDFAQVESEGNFSHTSIGLFKNSIISKIKIVNSIPAKHPLDFSKVIKQGYQSDEYLKYISN